MKLYTAGLQLPETNETIFRLGPKLVVLFDYGFFIIDHRK